MLPSWSNAGAFDKIFAAASKVRCPAHLFVAILVVLLLTSMSGVLADAAAQSRKPALDVELYRSLRGDFATSFAGFWSDGTTLWVDRPPFRFIGNIGASFHGETLHAYDLATGTRDNARDIPVAARIFRAYSSSPRNIGIWSDGTTMWVARGSPFKVLIDTHTRT